MSAVSSTAELFPRLLADVGGTNARFAWQAVAGGPIEDVRVLPGDDFATLQAAIERYLQGRPEGDRPRVAAVAIANPITGDEIRMTNRDWHFSQRQLREALGLDALLVVNDFTALALALPALDPADIRQVGGGTGEPAAPRALLGAGTGLGVSGLLPDGRGGWVAIEGEGGHVSLPAITARERVVHDGLAKRYGRVSAERLLCGQGLLEAFQILCECDEADPLALNTAAAVSQAALIKAHPQAVEALDIFCGTLGRVAGDLVLTLGARGGVYIGGGIVPRLGRAFDLSRFRAEFEDKGRFRHYLESVPVWVITASESPALLGAARALDRAV